MKYLLTQRNILEEESVCTKIAEMRQGDFITSRSSNLISSGFIGGIIIQAYKRYFITLHQEQKDYAFNGNQCFGHCIIEVSGKNGSEIEIIKKNGNAQMNKKGKLSVSVQNLKPEIMYKVVLVSCDSSKSNVYHAVTAVSFYADQKGKGSAHWEFDHIDVGNSHKSIDEYKIVCIITGSENNPIIPLVGYHDSFDKSLMTRDWMSKLVFENERGHVSKDHHINKLSRNCEEDSIVKDGINTDLKGEQNSEAAINNSDAGCTINNSSTSADMDENQKQIAYTDQNDDMDIMRVEIHQDEQIQAKEEEIYYNLPFLEYCEADTVENEANNVITETLAVENEEINMIMETLAVENEENNMIMETLAVDNEEQGIEITNHENEADPHSNICYEAVDVHYEKYDNAYDLESVMEHNLVMKPFADQKMNIKWVRISIREMAALSYEFHSIMNHPMIVYSYQNYNHMILGKYVDKEYTHYILGIPEVYDGDCRTEAEQLGFTQFKPLHEPLNGENFNGLHGYWLRVVDI